MESDGNDQVPAYMELANTKFALKQPRFRDNVDLKNKLLEGIIAGNMAPYYNEVCKDLGWEMDPALMATMSEYNQEKLATFDQEQSVRNNMSDDDLVPKKWYEKLTYLCSIGDKENATILALAKYEDPSLSINHRLDAVFTLFRIAYFHGCDLRGMKIAMEKAKGLITRLVTGDWSARNKLNAYEAMCCLGFREYDKAASLFLDCLATFESYELASFKSIVSYTLLSAMIALPRSELREKLTSAGSLSQALQTYASDANEYFKSLYDCRYADFFQCLARLETKMQLDPLLSSHCRHYVREMRLRAYRQILAAYLSLTIRSMAEAFGVSQEYIEDEVGHFVAAGRMQCKIDHVAGVIVTGTYSCDCTGPCVAPALIHARGELYQSTIKCGDNLLNRVNKLARVMDF